MIAKTYGWTPREISQLSVMEYLYWSVKAMELQVLDILKIQILLVGDEEKEENSYIAGSKEEALKIREDELQGFPYDVTPLTERECDEWIRYSERLKEKWRKKGSVGNIDMLWDEERKKACLSGDIVQVRASMNNFLWKCLKRAKELGFNLSLGKLKELRRLEILMTRYKQNPDKENLENLIEWRKRNGRQCSPEMVCSGR
ncbi:hypothetical protein J7M23_09585 [Candidatus Sumerlaeota bacterium]|nr:hypothetical protein [Candidatus Sumerlaeota bacterium]